MVEVIWPLSVVPHKGESGNCKGVLPLRTYIEETLRRSRTSYSTLQVALYYLILIKDHVPKCDFTMEQQVDSPSARAMQCGRRMFLAALILASKYLQDRNYSAKAWSKMSGLKVSEINMNERAFLLAVNWKLHIPDCLFKRWTDIVLRFTPNPNPPSPGQGLPVLDNKSTWKVIVPLLTPELDTVTVPTQFERHCPDMMNIGGLSSPNTPTPIRSIPHSVCGSQENTPTPLTILPRFLEPKPDLVPPTPALVRMGPLPTPQMTPSTIVSSTPAVSVSNFSVPSSRRPSICSAMAQAQRIGLSRCSIDQYPSRRPSLAPSSSDSGSSPESMISDVSRSSRASSISSVSTVSTTSTSAPTQGCLARLATCRRAGMPMQSRSEPARSIQGLEYGTANKPITILEDVDMVSSPDFDSFRIHDDATPVPVCKSQQQQMGMQMQPQPSQGPSPTPTPEKCAKKRTRSKGAECPLQATVRSLLQFRSGHNHTHTHSRFSSRTSDVDMGMDMEVLPDNILPSSSPLSPSVIREATANLIREEKVRAAQPPARLGRRGSGRLPVEREAGRKRGCCSTAAPPASAEGVYGDVEAWGMAS